MFVTKSKYNEAVARADALWRIAAEHKRDLEALAAKWNRIVRQINSGELVSKSSVKTSELTRAEVDTLIRLCHPDKHGGSQSANDITARLLGLRNTLDKA